MSDQPIIDWAAWITSPPGRYVLAWEQAQLDRLVSDMFGFHALQLGLPQLDALRENRMPCHGLVLETQSGVSAALHCSGSQANTAHRQVEAARRRIVWCDLLELPFESQSIDLIVMPHTLECTTDPHRLLREAERVLMPEGRLIITGFNSLSLWGARQSLGMVAKRPFIPTPHNHIAFIRLKDWIKLLGFDLERGRFGCYRPPLATDKWLARCTFMEAAGDRWWPIFGAAYMVTAIKRVPSIRLIGPLKMKKNVRTPGLSSAATPTTHHEHS